MHKSELCCSTHVVVFDGAPVMGSGWTERSVGFLEEQIPLEGRTFTNHDRGSIISHQIGGPAHRVEKR